MIPSIPGIWGMISGYFRSGPLHFVAINHNKPTKITEAQLQSPKSLPKFQRLAPKFRILLRHVWIIMSQAIEEVLDESGFQNLARTLAESILNEFQIILGHFSNLKILFIPFILGIWGMISAY